MARNVGKTYMEENLGKFINEHQNKILIGLGVLVLGLLLYTSRDYFSSYSGVVGRIEQRSNEYVVKKRSRRSVKVTCAVLLFDGEDEPTSICREDPEYFKHLKPRHRFVKPRFKRFMTAVGEEVEVPWLKDLPQPDGEGDGAADTAEAAEGGAQEAQATRQRSDPPGEATVAGAGNEAQQAAVPVNEPRPRESPAGDGTASGAAAPAVLPVEKRDEAPPAPEHEAAAQLPAAQDSPAAQTHVAD